MTRPEVHPTLAKLEQVSKTYEFPVALTGYIGPAPAGAIRLFPQLNLPEYIEIAADAVLHFDQPSDTDQTTLYVNPSADVRIVGPAEVTSVVHMDDAGPSGDGGTQSCVKLPLEACIECKYKECIKRQKKKGATDKSAKKVCDALKPILRVVCLPVVPPKKPEKVLPA